jgi:hypothetical protein
MPVHGPLPPVAEYSDNFGKPGSNISIMGQALQGRDYTVNTHDTTGITVTIKSNVTTDMISPSQLGSGPDTVIDNGSGNITLNLGGGNDTFNENTSATGKVYNLTGAAGDDQFFFNTNTDVNLNYQSHDGHDTVNGFDVTHDTLTLIGFTQSDVSVDTSNAAGDVIHFGDVSVQLNGVHETAQQLINDGLFVFA